jgi:reverse transcriptase-like protein
MLGHKDIESPFSSSGNLEEIGHNYYFSANVAFTYSFNLSLPDHVHDFIRGEAHEVRFADDFILCFQYKEDAERVLEVLKKRFVKYGLTLHPEKTRLLEFGKTAVGKAERLGGKPPETFDFLGFTHIARRNRRGYFTIHVRMVGEWREWGWKLLPGCAKRLDSTAVLYTSDPIPAR